MKIYILELIYPFYFRLLSWQVFDLQSVIFWGYLMERGYDFVLADIDKG